MIKLTDKAKSEVTKLLVAKGDPDYFFRVGVKGGGCSGFTYTVKLDNQLDPKDKVFEMDEKTKVVCDLKSHLYLAGIQIDFSTDLVAGGFRFVNPNATGSCGCGTSFSA